MPKAILVKTDNMQRLADQYEMDVDEVKEMLGTYLVTDFGMDKVVYGFMNEKNFNDNFMAVTDGDLRNGYFEVIKV